MKGVIWSLGISLKKPWCFCFWNESVYPRLQMSFGLGGAEGLEVGGWGCTIHTLYEEIAASWDSA